MEKLLNLFVIVLGLAASSNAEDSNRIIGGLPASENQFQYMVSLQKISQIQNDTRGHRCGGAMISYQHVLTAASCTFNNNNGALSPINVTEFRVFAGSVRLTHDKSEDNVRGIANITVHPSFLTSQLFADDIAVITLISPFSSNVVKPVELSVRDVGPTEIGACTVSGWGGQNTSATESTQLMYSVQTVYNWAACALLYLSLPPPHYLHVPKTMICAYAAQPTAGCVGDIGNPLVCRNRLTGIAALIQNCTTTAIPEVYTKVSSYTSWINGVMHGSASTAQPGIALLAIFAVAAAKIIT